MAGILYVVATPIGNLDDITRRGVEILKSVEIIACEDTRRSRVLLDHIGAKPAKLLAHHVHNEQPSSAALVTALLAGDNVALISDAGTPVLCDPGYVLINAVTKSGIQVVPIPGASALTAMLSACHFPTNEFYFAGFLPAKAAARLKRIDQLARLEVCVVFFEAPHRMLHCLADFAEVVPARLLAIGRELTKRHEDIRYGNAGTLSEELQAADALRGEFICVLEATDSQSSDLNAAKALMQTLLSELPLTKAAKVAARLTGLSKSQLYDLGLAMQGKVNPVP